MFGCLDWKVYFFDKLEVCVCIVKLLVVLFFNVVLLIFVRLIFKYDIGYIFFKKMGVV